MEGFFVAVKSSKSKKFALCCACFVFGIFTALSLGINREYLFIFCALFLFIAFLFIFYRRLYLLFLLFVILGLLRVILSIAVIDNNHISFSNGKKIEIESAVIVKEPDVRIGYVNYVIKERGKRGKVLVRSPLYPVFSYGDEVEIKCNLKRVENFADKFQYDKYLAMSGVYSICYYPSIKLVDINKGKFVRGYIIIAKTKFANSIDMLWPEPKSSFMAGLLYGSRSGLSENVMENFNRTGITHIIAISGYNITIVVMIVMTLLIAIGFWRRQAFWGTLAMLFFFVLFTGATASVVRAGVMGSIGLLAKYWGRQAKMGNIILLALALMLVINPLVLFYDVGFQLSFLATIGLVYICPIFEKIIFRYKMFSANGIIKNFVEMVIATLSAIIATLPLVIYQFGRISVVAVIVNCLILWLIPILMLFGFLSVIISYIFYPAGQILAWITGFGLDYIIAVVNFFGQMKWASINIEISLFSTVIAYIILLIVIVKKV